MLQKLNEIGISKKLHIVDRSICTETSRGTSACYANLGDPLINSEGQLIGILTWGVLPCGRGPHVYSMVGYTYTYYWLSELMTKNYTTDEYCE